MGNRITNTRAATLALALTCCTLGACGSSDSPEPPPPPAPPPEPAAPQGLAGDPALVERGRYLVEGIASCGNCHTPRDAAGQPIPARRLSGAFVIAEPGFTAYAPNITPHTETGVGTWTDEELIRAIREGIHPTGRILGPPMSFGFYRSISDTDIRSIVAYLRTVPPIDNLVPRSEYNIPLPASWGPPVVSVPDVPRDDRPAYGAYLAGPIGHCIDCHTPLVNGQLALERVGEGGNVYERPFGQDWAVISSNITSHATLGLGAWTDAEIKRAITQGISRDGRQLLPFMGFSFYRNVSDEDLDAVIAYLRTLPPQPAP